MPGQSTGLPSKDMRKYGVQILKKRKSKKGLEYFVHYVGWPNTYDEWKLAKDITE